MLAKIIFCYVYFIQKTLKFLFLVLLFQLLRKASTDTIFIVGGGQSRNLGIESKRKNVILKIVPSVNEKGISCNINGIVKSEPGQFNRALNHPYSECTPPLQTLQKYLIPSLCMTFH